MRSATAVASGALILAALMPATASSARAQGTPLGRYAASCVDQAIFEHVHGNVLYTHDGDDNGYGPEHDLSRLAIEAELSSYGFTPVLDQFVYQGQTYYNVVAERLGTTRPEDIYVVGAHWDSVDNPGADDNASGVAALLEIARLIGQWESAATIRLIAFDREEQGLRGSAAYVLDHLDDNFAGMVALDMLAWREGPHSLARIYGRALSDSVKYPLAAAVADYAHIQCSVHGLLDRSDHAPFEQHGFPAAWLMEYDFWTNPYYHLPSDSLDTPGYIDYDYALALTRGVLGWLVEAAGVVPSHPTGDLNCDYRCDAADINAFVLALSSAAAYSAAYPDCDRLNADIDGDGEVSFGDINAFVSLLISPCAGPQVVGKLLTTEDVVDARFGGALALRGDTLLVGARADAAPDVGAGAAYVFTRAGADWADGVRLVADDAAEFDAFGTAVALGADTALIGAPGDDDGGELAGAAYVFTHSNGTWSQSCKLTADDAAAEDAFGSSVALDGDVAVIGAPGRDGSGYDMGAVYVFEHSGDAWTQQTMLLAWDGLDLDNFGFAVAIDGDVAVVGAPYHDEEYAARGAAYVFERIDGAWTPAARLTADDGADYDRFGWNVALRGDTIVVGAFRDSGIPTALSAAYVFDRHDGVWTRTTKLGTWTYTYGIPLAIDGDTIIVGRDFGNLPQNAGAARLFRRIEGVWQRQSELTAWDASASAMFGTAVAIEAATVVCGATYDYAPASGFGTVYVFDLNGAGTPWIAAAPVAPEVILGQPVTLTVSAVGRTTLNYRWRKDGHWLHDDEHVSGAMTATLTIDAVTAADAGVYDVVVSSLCGTVTSPAATLVVPPAAPPGSIKR